MSARAKVLAPVLAIMLVSIVVGLLLPPYIKAALGPVLAEAAAPAA